MVQQWLNVVYESWKGLYRIVTPQIIVLSRYLEPQSANEASTVGPE